MARAVAAHPIGVSAAVRLNLMQGYEPRTMGESRSDSAPRFFFGLANSKPPTVGFVGIALRFRRPKVAVQKR